MLSSDIIYAAIDVPMCVIKLNALDGSFLVKKILYYTNYAFTNSAQINFLGYAPNA